MGSHYLEVWQPQRRDVVVLEVERVTVGKAASNDIPLRSDRTVSRLHAVLERFAAGWACNDAPGKAMEWRYLQPRPEGADYRTGPVDNLRDRRTRERQGQCPLRGG